MPAQVACAYRDRLVPLCGQESVGVCVTCDDPVCSVHVAAHDWMVRWYGEARCRPPQEKAA